MDHRIIDIGGKNDKESLCLSTREGNHIPNVLKKALPKEKLRAIHNIHKRLFPDIKLRSLTAIYNCLGMVFASRRSAIDADYTEWILHEDKYKRLDNIDNAQRGDVIVYRNDDNDVTHVGIVISTDIIDIARAIREIWVMSKWGDYGEYFHRIGELPITLGKPTEAWTDRR